MTISFTTGTCRFLVIASQLLGLADRRMQQTSTEQLTFLRRQKAQAFAARRGFIGLTLAMAKIY